MDTTALTPTITQSADARSLPSVCILFCIGSLFTHIGSGGSNSVTVTITDRCEGCAHDDLDFSPTAFNQLAKPEEGRVQISWNYADGS